MSGPARYRERPVPSVPRKSSTRNPGAAAPRSARQDDGRTSAGGPSRLGERYPGCLLAAGGCEDELGAALFGDLTNQGWPIFLKQREGVVLVACLTGQRLLLALAVHFPGELAIGLESQCDRQVRGGLSLPGTHEAGRRRRRRLGLLGLLCRGLSRRCAWLGRCRSGAGGLPRG